MRIGLIILLVIAIVPIISGLFERRDKTINVKAGATKEDHYPTARLKYKKNSSTRTTFVGEVGQRLELKCRIRFSRSSDTSIWGSRSGKQCSDDYFYIGYNRNRNIQGAKYYCGTKTLEKKSKVTTGKPVIVVGMCDLLLHTSFNFISLIESPNKYF